MENISGVFQKKNMERLSFITQLRLSLYYRLPVAEKYLEKCLVHDKDIKTCLMENNENEGGERKIIIKLH